MVHVNALLTSIATVFFYNDTDKYVNQSVSSIDTANFYFINKKTSHARPLLIESDLNNDIIYFPKCCPPQYIFESAQHRCVQREATPSIYDDLGFNVSFVKSGLSNCEVVVDRAISEFELNNFGKDRTLLIDNEIFVFGKYCLDKLSDGSNDYIARLCYPKEYCTSNVSVRKDWCMKKCCKDGHVLNGKTCISKPDLGLDIKGNLDVIEKNDSIALYTDSRICRRYEAKKQTFKFSIKANGSFFIYERKIWKEYKVDELMYCMDTSYNTITKAHRNIFKLCVISNAGDIKFQFSKPAIIISCICLLITIFTYIFVYKLQKIIQSIIVGYCFFLMVFYVLTYFVHSISDFGKYCEAVGFTLFFSYIASFSWMNIMCFDIHRTVGSMKTSWRQSKQFILKRMTLYSLYGILMPLIVTLFLYVSYKRIIMLPQSVHPYLIVGKCIIIKRGLGSYGHIVHSVVPVGLLIAVNIVFFVKTLRYYLKGKMEIKRISGSSVIKKMQVNRRMIIMIMKLSLVMGISWIFEIISLTINFKQNRVLEVIEVIFDTFNYLQGLFVFLIFLVKWDTIKGFLPKIKFNKILKGRKQIVQIPNTNSLMETETGF